VWLPDGDRREWLSLPERSVLLALLREEESRLVKFRGGLARAGQSQIRIEVQLHDVRPGPLLLVGSSWPSYPFPKTLPKISEVSTRSVSKGQFFGISPTHSPIAGCNASSPGRVQARRVTVGE
jgi:hypothetical protein